LILLAGYILLFGFSDVRAQRENIILANNDKKEIIKQMLTTEVLRYKKDESKYGRLPDGNLEIILSLENIEPDLVPKIKDVKFILLKNSEIYKRIEHTRVFGGVRYLSFSDFKIKGSKIIVSLDNTYKAKRGRAFVHSKSFEYEFRKVNGKWEGKLLREGGLIT
jgi:hypothetical protein